MGLVGRIGFKEEKVFDTLLKLDTLRGPHSTGVLFVNTKGEAEVVKSLGTPWDLSAEAEFKRVNLLSHNVRLGHNRYATKGAITAENAHPFEVGNLVGAHNGTLSNQRLLDDSHKFDVDSENIYHHMNIHGVEATCKVLHGAYALTWYDKEVGTLNFLRNKERTLYYTFTEDKMTMAWASERWMLSIALSREGFKFEEIREFKTEHHYEVLVPLGLWGQAVPIKDEDISVKKLEAYVPPPPKKFLGNYSQDWNRGRYVNTSNVANLNLHNYINREVAFKVVGERTVNYSNFILGELISGERINVRVFNTPKNDVWNDLLLGGTFTGLVKHVAWLDGGYLVLDSRSIQRDDIGDDEDQDEFMVGCSIMDKKETLKFLEKGCTWCSEVERLENAEEVYVLHDNNYVCMSCCTTDEVKNYLN